MKQLPLFSPFSQEQQATMLDALAVVRWPDPQPPGCNCDTCRHARDAQAIRDGRLSPTDAERIANELWNLPGIHQPPPSALDSDCYADLHRRIYAIRWQQKNI